MKKYQYKHYDKNGDFVQVIDEKIINTEVSFSDTLLWPQGRFYIWLNISWADSIFEQGDYIKVFCVNEYFPKWFQIYYGYIHEIDKQASSYENVFLEVYGVGSLLERVFYKDTTYNFTNNVTAKTHLDAILDYFDTLYPWVIQKGDISNPAGNINKEFDYETCLSWVKSITELFSDTHYWYIDRLGFFQFKAYADSTERRVTFQKDIQELSDRWEIEIVNKLHLFYDGWNKTYEDTASITKYGLYEKKITDTSIADLTSADTYWDDYIEKNKEIEPSIDLVLNNEFTTGEIAIWDDSEIWNDNNIWEESISANWFEGLELGDIVKIVNRQNGVLGYIKNKTYTRDTITLVLGKYENVIWLIRNDG